MATITEELLILIKSIGGMGAAEDVDKVAAASGRSGRAAKAAKGEHLGFSSALGSLKSIAFQTAGLAGVGGLALGVGAAVKQAQAFQVANAALGLSIKNNVRFPARDATDQMDKFAESLSVRGGFGPVQAIQSMSRLLVVTRDQARAQKDMALATDIARGTHTSLERATRAVMMVEAGRTTGLSRMGIFLTQVKTAQDALTASGGKHTAQEKEAAKIQDQNATRIQGMTMLWQKFGGQTAAYSKTAAGSISNLKNTVDLLAERLGRALLPIISSVTGALSGFVRQMISGRGAGGEVVKVGKDLGDVLKVIFQVVKDTWPVLAALTALWAAYKVEQIASAAVTAITTSALVTQTAAGATEAGMLGALQGAWAALTVTMDANPIMIVVLAIAALVIGLIEAYKHVTWFRDAVNAMGKVAVIAFNWLKGAAVDVFDWIKAHWPLLLAILTGPFGAAAIFIITHWSEVKKLPGEILKAFEAAGRAILDAIVWPFKEAAKLIEKIPVIGKLLKIGGGILHKAGGVLSSVGHFLGFQGGGVTPYSGSFVVGESGPELITLPSGSNVSSQNDLKQTNALLRELIVAVQQNSSVLMVDGKVLAQAVARQGLLQASRS